MNKKLKKEIYEIVMGILLFATGFVLTAINKYLGTAAFVLAYSVLGFQVFKGAWFTVRHGHLFDENFLMLLATVGAWIMREYEEAVAVILFFRIGECFQSYAVNKSRKSIKALMSIRADFARRIVNGKEENVNPSKLAVDEVIKILPGERIPVDAVIIEGSSYVDTSSITGESVPRRVKPGDDIVSGCINNDGVIVAKVRKVYRESTVSRILKLVEEAQNKKAKAEKFITLFARYYTPVIVALSILVVTLGTIVTKDFATWIYRAMTFLLISCPCALVISIPLSFFGGIGGAGKHGILIKGGNYLDAISKINVLVVDKTGTLTKGNFDVTNVYTAPNLAHYLNEIPQLACFTGGDNNKDNSGVINPEGSLIKIAAILEKESNHPIAKAVLRKYNELTEGEELPISFEFTDIPGEGIKAIVSGHRLYVGNRKLLASVCKEELMKSFAVNESDSGTSVYVAIDECPVGLIEISDEIKDNVANDLRIIKRSGVKKIVMLTGDNEKTAAKVANILEIDEYKANLSPIDKVECLEGIMAQNNKDGFKTAFVGDGINDAPVLSRADIGIAMGALGQDAAIEAADVVIMTDELYKISEARKIANKTLRIVKENIILALGIKILVLFLATIGIAAMWMAIVADVGVAFAAILNSMRALKY